MIDLHADELSLAAYCRRFSEFSPPKSPGLAFRMGAIEEKEARLRNPDFDHTRWLSNPDYGIGESLLRSKAHGAMLGSAIGDAIGTTLEFCPRDSRKIDDMVGGGPFNLKAGEWTDDTTMALCLADSLLEKNGFDPASFADYLIQWYREGYNSVNGRCFDIGNTTREAIVKLEKPGPRWAGSSSPDSAGNGSLVREISLAIAYRKSLLRLWSLSKAQSAVTHGAGEAINSCQLFGMLLSHALNGGTRNQVLSPKIAGLFPRPMIINVGEYKLKSRHEIRSSGYVIDTLEAALWSVWKTDNFRDAVLLAANLGDDADSVASVTGQLAGSLYGVEAIPEEWVSKLAWAERIQDTADRLFQLQLA